MRQSARAIRMARHHKRLASSSKLNLVSLMDIFTILVFFLIVNQSEVRVLQNTQKLSLPVSIADQLPSENLVIAVFQNSVLVQERAVWERKGSQVDNVDLTKNGSYKPTKQQKIKTQLNEIEIEQLIVALKVELNYQSNKRPQLTTLEQEQGRAVTIIGDASIEYDLLKQIMAVCADTNYRNMSLAVEQKLQKNQARS